MLNKKSCLYALILVVAVFTISSCHYTRWRDFNPISEELPIRMFGSYQLEIEGYASGAHRVYFDITFVNAMIDTTDLDTIPIFIIDSVCYFGECLDSQLCDQPMSWFEVYSLYGFTASSHQDLADAELIRDQDLWLDDGRLFPGGYTADITFRLPPSCVDSSVSIDLFARLIERESHELISSEIKRIRMLIKDRKRFEPLH